MTYCCGVHVRNGIVAMAEQRVLNSVAGAGEYPAIAGCLIECASQTPYYQIRGHRSDKPVLNQVVSFDTDIFDELKIGLVSTHRAVPTPPSRGVES